MSTRRIKLYILNYKTTSTFAALALIWPLAVAALSPGGYLPAKGATTASVNQSWQAVTSITGQSSTRSRGLSPESRSRIRQAISAVGLIVVRNVSDSADKNPRPRGSAVVIQQDGIIATNYHVIAKEKSTELY